MRTSMRPPVAPIRMGSGGSRDYPVDGYAQRSRGDGGSQDYPAPEAKRGSGLIGLLFAAGVLALAGLTAMGAKGHSVPTLSVEQSQR